MALLQAATLQTYYERIGKGPTLLLLHGWANTWEAWLPLIPYLSDHFTLIIPDLPGCGKTQTPTHGWSTKDHACWLESFISLLPLTSSLFCCGHSYGGKILLEYCSGNYVPQPQKVVLIDSSGVPSSLRGKQKLVQSVSALIPRYIKKKLPKSIKKTLYESLDSDYAVANEFQKQTLRIILREDYTDRLSHVTQPTLLLWGKDDAATPLWQGDSMRSLIPLNQFYTFQTGHFPHHQFPGKVSEKICQFL